MRSQWPQENNRCNLAHFRILGICLILAFFCGLFSFLHPAISWARSAATPWTPEINFQSLVYGASSPYDVVRAVGSPPDEVVHSQQMFPVIENYYYFDPEKTGAATVFVFENGLLVGLQLKTAGNQYIDFTYCLANNGDRQLFYPMMQNYSPYYPTFPLTAW